MRERIGPMRERITLQSPEPVARKVVSLIRVGNTVTVVTQFAHGFNEGEFVAIAGATPDEYNGEQLIATVPTSTSFTFTESNGSLATPATGAITATFSKDVQGGVDPQWHDVATVRAELMPVRTTESFQQAAVVAERDLRFRLRSRVDVRPTWRAVWTASWPRAAAARTLEIRGVLPFGDGRQYMVLECGETS